ncbi:MAG: NAAT family transporter [Acidisphaera sp.]|nr:NAAT family transporter [Acidisphaera sp.]
MPAVDSFLLAFPAFFSIVNPIAGAFIFNAATAEGTHAQRGHLSNLVGLYALAVLLVALWLGAYILHFFGITLGALRIAGGAAVAISAWELLARPEQRDDRKRAQVAGGDQHALDDMAFFPLTMPFTTGPGTISVAIAIGAERPSRAGQVIPFYVGVSVAAVAMAATIWLLYRSSDRIEAFMSEAMRKTITRLSAFLLLCIGVQILVNGVTDVVEAFLRDHAA